MECIFCKAWFSSSNREAKACPACDRAMRQLRLSVEPMRLYEMVKPSIPEVDAQPVKHGRWINEDFPDKIATPRDIAKCSVCGELSDKAEHGYAILSKCCPNCGAKMDLEDEDGNN